MDSLRIAAVYSTESLFPQIIRNKTQHVKRPKVLTLRKQAGKGTKTAVQIYSANMTRPPPNYLQPLCNAARSNISHWEQVWWCKLQAWVSCYNF
eukprot:1469701-Amphidinium_carterae.1